MSTGPEHYREAERLLDGIDEVLTLITSAKPTDVLAVSQAINATAGMLVTAAQVHATLALAAATAYPAIVAYTGDETYSESRGWANVTAPAPAPVDVKCPRCDSQGVVHVGERDHFGSYDSTDCPLCGGDGTVTKDKADEALAEAGLS